MPRVVKARTSDMVAVSMLLDEAVGLTMRYYPERVLVVKKDVTGTVGG